MHTCQIRYYTRCAAGSVERREPFLPVGMVRKRNLSACHAFAAWRSFGQVKRRRGAVKIARLGPAFVLGRACARGEVEFSPADPPAHTFHGRETRRLATHDRKPEP